jgi:adenine-specific DNA-methyltransferase
MASRKPTGPTPVGAITHDDKRANLPTADAQDLVTPDVAGVVPVAYPRELRSPMLVWQGKEALDESDLEVEAPPIYIQEKIDPRVLVENLRQTAKEGEPEPELTLFETFDGLGELDLVEFYKHPANWSNRMILGDSLQVMASLAERERLRGKVQMIYVDPPYGIKFGSNWQVSARKRDVKDGKLEDVAREVEQIKAFRDTWELGIHSYLTYLRDRLQVARDLLTGSGSIFVQIGDENVHLVRSLLDEIFGAENCVSQIVFRKTSGKAGARLDAVYDTLLWYARDVERTKVRRLHFPRADETLAAQYTWQELPDGSARRLSQTELRSGQAIPSRFKADGLYSESGGDTTRFPVELDGVTYVLPPKWFWKSNEAGMSRLRAAGRLIGVGRTLCYRRFQEDFGVVRVTNLWDDTMRSGYGEQRLYVVQTGTKVVERCLLMTTDPGDLVLDPTCGSGTTAYVAEQWGRRWITIDTSRVALALARQRLMGARFPYYLLADSVEGRRKESELSATPLPPATPGDDVRHGFVYERVPHIMLKSIANNPDIKEGMSREEIDRAIKRHADFELLYDKPFEDSRKVRVTGPFTVESLSPHRSLAGLAAEEPTSERQAADDVDSPTFEQTILENLRAAGIQNGRRAERLTFDVVEPYAATHIQAVGIREEAPEGAPKKVGICIGPQYGTVSPPFVKDAAREAGKGATDLDLLCILGFAFDPQVLNADEDFVATDEGFEVAGERSLGRIPVLLVRMNADLLMGEELKKTGAGNLFTVFGEPDIAVKAEGDDVTVELLGVDVFDPTTGEVRSSGTDQVALWVIDTDYNGESFFVRHCYFTGGQDPYKRLKTALRADIDEDGWATLFATTSRPFPRPSTGKIAVKVINDYGDEVVKVYEVS